MWYFYFPTVSKSLINFFSFGLLCSSNIPWIGSTVQNIQLAIATKKAMAQLQYRIFKELLSSLRLHLLHLFTSKKNCSDLHFYEQFCKMRYFKTRCKACEAAVCFIVWWKPSVLEMSYTINIIHSKPKLRWGMFSSNNEKWQECFETSRIFIIVI